jgi:hypothetical protein
MNLPPNLLADTSLAASLKGRYWHEADGCHILA